MGSVFSQFITWKGAFFALLLGVVLGGFFFITIDSRDIKPEETTYVFGQPAKYESGSFKTVNPGGEVIELKFVTVTGEHIPVTGDIAKDMDKHQVTLTGNSYVRLTYEAFTHYARSGKVIKSYQVTSWKPLPYEEHTGVSW